MAEQAARLAGHRARRERGAVDVALAAVKQAATSDATLMPRILDAVPVRRRRSGRSAGRLRAVFGEYQPRRRSDSRELGSIRRWFKNNPRTVFLVVVGVVLLGLFLGVITRSSRPRALPWQISAAWIPALRPLTSASRGRFHRQRR